MKGSFSDRVGQTVKRHWQVEAIFTTNQVAAQMGLTAYERRRLWTVLNDMARRGELEALGQSRWRRLGREERPEIKEIIWRLMRIHRVMTVEDLSLQSGASHGTVRAYLAALMNLGLVVNEDKQKGRPGRYRLVKDVGPERPADGNCERMHQYWVRKKQRAALEALDTALSTAAEECPGKNGGVMRAIAEARLAVAEIPEGSGQ